MKLDKYHYHEALDRTNSIQEIIENMLSTHPAIEQNSKWKKKMAKVQNILGKLYQLIGEKKFK